MPRESKYSLEDGGRIYRQKRKGQEVGAWRMEFTRGGVSINRSTEKEDAGQALVVAESLARAIQRATERQALGVPLDRADRKALDLPDDVITGVLTGSVKDQIEPFLMTRESGSAKYIENMRRDLKFILDEIQSLWPKTRRFSVDCFTTGACQQALVSLSKKRKHHAKSFNRVRAALRSFCEYLKPMGLTENPVERIPARNVQADPVRPPRSWTEEELVILINHVLNRQVSNVAGKFSGALSPDGEAALIFVGLYSGLRAGHIRQLTRDHISDFDGGIVITPPLNLRRHARKRAAAGAIVDPWACEIIRKYLMTVPANHPLFPIYDGYTGQMIAARTEECRKSWVEAADTPTERERRENSDFLRRKDKDGYVIHFHALRVTTATRAYDAGMPDSRVQKMLGHSHVAMTQKYDKPSAEKLLKQASMIPNLPRKAAG